MTRARPRALLGLGLVAAGIVALAFSGNLSVHATRFAVFYGLSLAGFALLATAASGLPLRGALLAAVVLRLVLLPGAPTLSDDFYRFLWDGRVQLGGTNPYVHAPGDAALDGVAYADRDDVDFPELRTPYPPLAQATFLAVAAVDGGSLALKLLFGLFDLATAAAVWWLADARRRHAATVLYLLCPVVIVQTWDAAHLEATAVFFVVLAAALLLRRRDAAAGAALGVAAAFRLTPLVLLVPALLGGRAKPARLLAGFIPAFVIPYVPYLATGGATGSLPQAGTGWTGQAFLFTPLARLASPEVARALCALVFVAGAVWVARRLRGRALTAPAFAWTLTLLVLCLPVAHAWYWLAPLALALAAGLWLPVAVGLLAPIPELFPFTWPSWLPPWRQALAAFPAPWQPFIRSSGEEGPRDDRRQVRRHPPGAHMVESPVVHHPAVSHTGRATIDPGTAVSQPPHLRLDAGARVLVVMARPLVPGAVKTRLAQAIGDAPALALYARLLRGTLAQAERLEDVTLVLAVAGAAPNREAREPDVRGGPGVAGTLAERIHGWQLLAQRGETLGDRLAAVFADAFAAGAGTVVAVDSDSPAIPLEYLEGAFTSAAGAPAAHRGTPPVSGTVPGRLVFGPAADGGYYLIGLDRETWQRQGGDVAGLLASSPMGTASLLSYTERAARVRGLELRQLPLWVDVDRPEDVALLERLDGAVPCRGEPLEGLREIYLHLTNRCGRTCRHCYNSDAAWDPDELTTGEWQDAVDQCAALGASSFVFIGGDPLLRDDFTALVDHITGNHEAKVRFFFNSLVDAATAHELARVGRGLLKPLVSIDGPREINDELRGDGCHDDVMESIANLRAVGLEPVANTVLVRPALPGLTQLARELGAAGLHRLHLILPHQAGGVAATSPPHPGGRSHARGSAFRDVPGGLDLVPSGDELLAAVRELLRVAAEIGMVVDNLPSWRRRLGARNDFCAAGCKDLAIDPYGDVHACVITAGDPAFVAGSLREQPLEEIWRASSSLRLLRAARARDRAECLVCPVVDACGGECWVQAHYAARAHERPAGYTAPFPYCDLVRPMFEELAAEAEPAVTSAPAGRYERGRPAADDSAGVACGAACETGGGQAAAGEADYALFDCI